MKILICNRVSDVNTSDLDINEIEDYLILLEHSSWNDFGYTVTFGGVSKSMLKKSRLNFDKIEKCK